MRWNKVGTVARFEFTASVMRKGYLIATFGMPLFMLLYGVLISIPAYFDSQKEKELKLFGVVDRSGLLQLDADLERPVLDLPDQVRELLDRADEAGSLGPAAGYIGNIVFRAIDDEAAARQAVLDRTIAGFYVLAPEFVETGRVDAYFPDELALSADRARPPMRSLLLERLLGDRLPPTIARRVQKPIESWNEWSVLADGEVKERTPFAVFARLLIPLLFAALFMISLMMSAGYLIQGTAVEKENRVVEVLLSSVQPEELMTGKLLGLGGAGLLQVAIWFGMIGVGALAFAGMLSSLGVDVPWLAIGVGIVFFIGGYLFLGSLMLGTGSLGSNMRESQQWSMIWSLLAVVPMMFVGVLLQEAHGVLGQVLSWIPFTSPLTLVLRLSLEPQGVPWWQIVGSGAVLALSIWFALRLGGRLFRVGILLTGARPKLRQIWAQIR